MSRDEDIQRAAALVTILAFCNHANVGNDFSDLTEFVNRNVAIRKEYTALIRSIWPNVYTGKAPLCERTLEACNELEGRDNYCPIHGRDIR